MFDQEQPPVRFEPVIPVHTYERVVEQIERAIVDGSLAPGQRLPGERELMRQFGVSRSTVREALRVLQAEALIRSRPGDPRGPEVLSLSPAGLQKSLRRMAGARTVRLGELLQFRMVLEGSAYQLAARLRTEDQLAEMIAALARMAGEVKFGPAAFGAAALEFQEIVARASANSLIHECGEAVREVVLSLVQDRFAAHPDPEESMRNSLEHHAEVLRAMRERDGARACRLARRALFEDFAEYLPADDLGVLETLLESP